MNWTRFGIVLFYILSMVGCMNLISKTAEGVNVDPIFSIELHDDFEQIDGIKKLMPSDACYRKEKGGDILIYNRIANQPMKPHHVFRGIEIYRFDTRAEAFNKYSSYKHQFSDPSRWRLYKEEGGEGNKYFCSYRLASLDFGHGIPPPEILIPRDILVAILKRNLVIVVDYNTYRDDTDYINEINEDISYVGDLLKKALGSN